MKIKRKFVAEDQSMSAVTEFVRENLEQYGMFQSRIL